MSSPKPPPNPRRSKAWGYEVEKAALKALRRIFPNLRRTGSLAYKKAAADLVQDGYKTGRSPIRLIVTRDKRRPLLVTLSIDDLATLIGAGSWEMSGTLPTDHVVVQVKGRAQSWVGSLYQSLKEATK